MTRASELATQALADADPATLPMSAASDLFARLRGQVPDLRRRAPDAAPERWVDAVIGGRRWRCAQPITFTPYASVRPCSARCRFCSETLRPVAGGTAAAALRPDDGYFDRLRRALKAVREVPLSWSLSGLEASDDPDWLRRLLEVLQQAECDGLRVGDRVLYSNGAGIARDPSLVDALAAFDLSWLELSRHADRADANAAIMRFRDGEPVAGDAAFVQAARAIGARLPLRMVCILQRGGIEGVAGVQRYLHWARDTCGADTVIFRELSRMGDGYRATGSHRYIESHRVGIDTLLHEAMATAWWRTLQPLEVTEGYYFWNLRLRTPEGTTVVFEASDYTAMHRCHASGDLYKLVFFADGRLCGGWEPDRDLVLDTRERTIGDG